MIRLMFVGDGKSDEAVVPRLVERILGTGVAEDARGWARLHGSGRGYHKKLRFAILAAKDSGAAGVVATIDRDRDRRGARLKAFAKGGRNIGVLRRRFQQPLARPCRISNHGFSMIRSPCAERCDFPMITRSRRRPASTARRRRWNGCGARASNRSQARRRCWLRLHGTLTLLDVRARNKPDLGLFATMLWPRSVRLSVRRRDRPR